MLVNNAGLIVPRREVSKDGYEMQFAVNYLSGYLLTYSLLPLLEKGTSHASSTCRPWRRHPSTSRT